MEGYRLIDAARLLEIDEQVLYKTLLSLAKEDILFYPVSRDPDLYSKRDIRLLSQLLTFSESHPDMTIAECADALSIEYQRNRGVRQLTNMEKLIRQQNQQMNTLIKTVKQQNQYHSRQLSRIENQLNEKMKCKASDSS